MTDLVKTLLSAAVEAGPYWTVAAICAVGPFTLAVLMMAAWAVREVKK